LFVCRQKIRVGRQICRVWRQNLRFDQVGGGSNPSRSEMARMAGTGQHFVDDDKKAAYLNCQWWV